MSLSIELLGDVTSREFWFYQSFWEERGNYIGPTEIASADLVSLPMTNGFVIGILSFDIVWDLGFGVWDLPLCGDVL
jgi:hypothetical protein